MWSVDPASAAGPISPGSISQVLIDCYSKFTQGGQQNGTSGLTELILTAFHRPPGQPPMMIMLTGPRGRQLLPTAGAAPDS